MPSTNVNISEIPVSTTDPSQTQWGSPLSAQYYFVLVNGTSGNAEFDPASISSATLALMATHTRGISVVTQAGNDTLAGSAYGDVFSAGAGTNKIDGGANQGTDPGGYAARDTLNVFVADSAAAAAVSVTAIASSGADAALYSEGYRIKVVNGSETDYLKNVEQINLFQGSSYLRSIALAVNVGEVGGSQDPATMLHLAWVQGTAFDDSFSAASGISSGTLALMATHGRGLWAELGAGDDSFTGSDYGDDINAGSGTNHIDGGANNGSPPWGGKAQDVLHVTVASQAAASAVAVTLLASGSGSTADQQAFTAGYTHKVVSGADTSYVKGIERVSVELVSGNSNTWVRDIPLTVVVHEADLADPAIGNYYHLAWVNGTANADSIDLSGSTPLLSAALRTALDSHDRGVWVDGGAGNDTITGTAYADNFRNGSGNSRIDGGANDGPSGQLARDVFEISVASAAQMSAVTVAASDDPAYTWMVTYGTGEKDYLKNIEAISINVSGTSTGKWIPLAVSVQEVAAGDAAASMHQAWAQGTAMDDSFNAATGVSAATQTLMANNGRGVWIDMGAGNDTIVGSEYGDDINAGSGTNYVAGGGEGGSPPWGGKAQDVLHVTVANAAAAAAVTVTQLSGASAGADLAAYNDGYVFKVGSGSDTTYIRGIERVSVEIAGSNGATTFARDIPLTVVVQEANLADTGVAQNYHLAWVNGTANTDAIDLSAATSLLSAPLRTALGTYGRGVWVDGGAGDDTITGTAYADNFRNGSGNAHIDGGANAGPAGQAARDVFEISVASTAELNSVQVLASDDAAWQWMVVYGTGQKDYLRNIEAVSVNVTGTSTGKWIPLAVDLQEIGASADAASSMHMAWAQGTGMNDSLNAAAVSAGTAALMATHGRGIYADMGAGDDTITGSAYGDDLNGGAGVNYVDGGANGGSPPWGGPARDVLHVTVASQADAAAVTVSLLNGSATGADATAFAAGYTHKVSANGETDYIKGIERVAIELRSGNTSTFVRDIPLAVVVDEANLASPDSANLYHLAWINGTADADTIDLSGSSPLLSANLRAELAARGKGVWVNGGSGNDTITGTAWGDNFVNGAGNAKIDGGANGGPGGAQGRDVFEIVVASAAELSAVTVALSDDPAYEWMVTYGTSQKDYLKNIEAVSVSVSGSGSGKWIPLALRIDEIAANTANLAAQPVFAWAEGTARDESFSAAADLSAATRTLMDQYKRGVYVDMGAGNDTITGSTYGDTVGGGRGTNYIDGNGASGANPQGQPAADVLEVFVASQAEAAAVQVLVLDGGMSGADLAAFNAGYKFKVVNGSSETDYVKNVGSVRVAVWEDKDQDGVRDYSANAAVNEVTPARTIGLTANTAPTFKGTVPGVSIIQAGQDFGVVGAIVQPDGKLLSLSYLDSAVQGDNYALVLQRSNADGSIDTSFGNGGRIEVPTSYGNAFSAPVLLASGKVLITVGTPGANADIKVLRLNADGSLDTSFGSGGATTVATVSGAEQARKLLLQTDGKILVAGTGNNGNNDFVVLRLNADGTLDTSYNGTGKLVVPVGAAADVATTALLQNDGKLVLAGSSASGSSTDYAAIRVNTDGTLDSSFGSGGKVVLPVGPAGETASAVALQGDKLILAGYSRSAGESSDYDLSLARLNANGTLDTSFGSGGKVLVHVTDQHDRIFAVQVQDDGKIVVAGTTGAAETGGLGGRFAVLRFNADGSPDTGFGVNGVARMPAHGLGDQVNSLAIVNGKIVLFGSTFSNTSFDTANVVARLNADGTLDATFATGQGSTVGGSIVSNGLRATVLDANAAVYDAELSAAAGYAGATLTLARHGGASASDVFGASGELSFSGGSLSVAGTVIGSVSQNGGVLTLSFNAQASQGLVNRALHGITYSNTSATLPSSIVIDWTFSDGNSGAQGLGGAFSASASTTVNFGPLVTELEVSKVNNAQSTTGVVLAQASVMATVDGSNGADNVSLASFSAAAQALMAQYQRGAYFHMNAGDDTVSGTGYSDIFVLGAGTNRADGGAQAGSNSSGPGAGRDMLVVYAPTAAAAAAVSATQLSAASTGADAAAYADGYQVKVVNGGETDYVKDIELVSVQVWNDANANGLRDAGEVTWSRDIPLAMLVNEVRVSSTDPTRTADGQLLSASYSLAWGEGSFNNDSFNAATDVSSATQALMASYGRGVWADGRGGNDTIVGSGYGDDLTGGAGTNYIDGGADAGTMADGTPGYDMLQVYTATTAEANAVTVSELSAAMSGADGAAYAAGYRFKVVNGSTETDYLKNVEQVNVQVWNDKDGDGQRDYSSDAAVNEVSYVRGISLASNSAPTFAGVPAGVALNAGGADFGTLGGTVLGNGKLLSVSYYRASAEDGNYVLVLNRSNADGTVDGSFGSGGKVALPTSFDAVAAPVELADGKILLAVGTQPAGSADFSILRLNADGSLDSSFGSLGRTTVSLSGARDAVTRLLVDPDSGAITVVGTSGATGSLDIAVLRLNANGTPDSSFDGDGKLLLDFSATDTGASAVLQPNGKLVIAGVGLGGGGNTDFSAVRLNADGSLDSTFGSGGRAIFATGLGAEQVAGIKLQADGKLVLGGSFRTGAANTSDFDLALARLNADGSLDTSFGNAGIRRVHVSNADDRITAIDVQADGKIVALAMVNDTAGRGAVMTVLRFNADGSTDAGFGNNGQASLGSLGIRDQAYSVQVVGGKIVVFGSTYQDTNANTANVLARLNADGSPDPAFNPAPASSLNTTVTLTGWLPDVLNPHAAVYDAELAARGNYGGASLTLARNGGAQAEDVFSALGEVSFANGELRVDNVQIGWANLSGGTLTLNFNQFATQGLVTRALHGIGYSNTSLTPPSTLTINWTFSDNNDGSQGFGGAATATGSTTVNLQSRVYEVAQSNLNPANASFPDGEMPLSQVEFLAEVYGTRGADTFDADSGLSAAVRGLMSAHGRGAIFSMGSGDDTVSGTAFSDLFVGGAGVNRIDGRGQGGSHPWLNAPKDLLEVYVANQAAADAVQASALSAASTGADLAAFNAGYTVKIVSGSETDYLKDIELVTVRIGQPGPNAQWARDIPLVTQYNEVQLNAADASQAADGTPLAQMPHFAWATSTFGNDVADAALLSQPTRDLMAQYGRGMYFDTGAGDDTITGSAYADSITAGSGTNYVDGGAHGGSVPGGQHPADVLEVWVASTSAGQAVTATLLTAASTGADAAAFGNGYQYRIDAGAETDYVRNVEVVNISLFTDSNGNGQRDPGEMSFLRQIALSVQVSEVAVNSSDATRDAAGNLLSSYLNLAWFNGSLGNDSVTVASELSSAALATLTAIGRGVYADLGGGDDHFTGSGFGDNVALGSGTNYYDGGANAGSNPQGDPAADVLEVYVASQTEADAVTLTALASGMSGADGDAYAAGYRYRVNSVNEVDYLVNVENVNVQIWTDLDADGQRDYSNGAGNEVEFARLIGVA